MIMGIIISQYIDPITQCQYNGFVFQVIFYFFAKESPSIPTIWVRICFGSPFPLASKSCKSKPQDI